MKCWKTIPIAFVLSGCNGVGLGSDSDTRSDFESPDHSAPFDFFELNNEKLNAPKNTNKNDDCFSSIIDSSGDLYCAGYTSSDLGDSYSTKSVDAFVMKISKDGTVRWIYQAGANSPMANQSTICRSLAIDSQNNLICAGDLAVQTSSSIQSDIWLMKISPSGKLLWNYHLSNNQLTNGTTAFPERCNSVAVDKNDDIICAGNTAGQLSEPRGGGAQLNSDLFFMKLSKSGELKWMKQIGSISKPEGGDASGDDNAKSAVLDLEGNIYFCGGTTGSLAESNGGSTDIIWGKLSSLGNLLWTKQIGQTTSTSKYGIASSEFCNSLALDKTRNRLYLGGSTQSNLTQASGGSSDIFLAAASATNGNILWVRHWGQSPPATIQSTNNIETISSVQLSQSGRIFVGGIIFGHGQFVESMGSTHSTSGTDPFVAEFNLNGDLTWIRHIGKTTLLDLKIPAVNNFPLYDLKISPDDKLYLSGTRDYSNDRQSYFLKINPEK